MVLADHRRAIMLAPQVWSFLRLITDDHGPGPDLPPRDQSLGHIGILINEVLHDSLIYCSKDEQGTVGWISQCSGKHDLAASVGFLGKAQVLLSKRQPLVGEIV